MRDCAACLRSSPDMTPFLAFSSVAPCSRHSRWRRCKHPAIGKLLFFQWDGGAKLQNPAISARTHRNMFTVSAATLSSKVTSQKMPTRQNSCRCALAFRPRSTFQMARKIVSISDALLKTGSVVPNSGIYAVRHDAHPLPSEVTLTQGELFPRCEACDDEVQFRLVRKLVERDPVFRFRVQLYQLPVLDQPQRKTG